MMTTIKLYDRDAYATEFEAKVVSCEMVEDQGRYAVVLEQTLFFPEEGGQTPDQGTLNGEDVLDVQICGNVITHFLAVSLAVGSTVSGKIDWKHRFSNMQQHSGEHIFSGLAYEKYGSQNVGFHLSNQIVTMDFDRVFSEMELLQLEWEVNEAIAANVEVTTGYPSTEELAQMQYRSKKELEEAIRIVEIKGYDVCACCAPHVHRTGEIGSFKIQSAQNYKGGMRISFLCGFRALEEYRNKSTVISELMSIMTTNQGQLAENVRKLKNHAQTLKGQWISARQTIMESRIEKIPAEQKDVIWFEQETEMNVIRNAVNRLMEKHDGICAVFAGNDTDGYSYIIGSRTSDCREITALLREKFQARGGGAAQMVQGAVSAKEAEIVQLLTSCNANHT